MISILVLLAAPAFVCLPSFVSLHDLHSGLLLAAPAFICLPAWSPFWPALGCSCLHLSPFIPQIAGSYRGSYFSMTGSLIAEIARWSWCRCRLVSLHLSSNLVSALCCRCRLVSQACSLETLSGVYAGIIFLSHHDLFHFERSSLSLKALRFEEGTMWNPLLFFVILFLEERTRRAELTAHCFNNWILEDFLGYVATCVLRSFHNACAYEITYFLLVSLFFQEKHDTYLKTLAKSGFSNDSGSKCVWPSPKYACAYKIRRFFPQIAGSYRGSYFSILKGWVADYRNRCRS